MMQNELITKRPVAAIGEEIGVELGAQMVKAYHEANPNDIICYTIGKKIIEEILAQPGCEGIRFYNAYNEQGVKTLVYLAVDAEEQPLKEYRVVDNKGTIGTRKPIVADRNKGSGGSWWDFIIFW